MLYHHDALLIEFLEKINFYMHLNEANRTKFLKRIKNFIHDVVVINADGSQTNFVQRLLIANIAVQITFGLDNYSYEPLKRIIIHPQLIRNKKTNQLYKGLTFNNGVIHLYWNAVLDGFSNNSDGINLVLHELTHALMITLNKADEPDVRFASYFDKWLQIAMQEQYRLSKTNLPFLRSYAHTNKAEMFSVCVENFFERPKEMSTKLPDTYNHMCYLLNVNPLNFSNNFILEDSFIQQTIANPHLVGLPEIFRPNYKYHAWHWSLFFWSIGTPLGWGFFFVTLKYVMLPIWAILFVLIPISAFVFYKLFENHFIKKEILTKKQYRYFIGTVGAPLMFSVLIFLNYNISVTSTRSVYYNVPQDFKLVYNHYDMDQSKSYFLDNLLPFEANQFNLPNNINAYTQKLEVKSSRGIFGIKNCKDCIAH